MTKNQIYHFFLNTWRATGGRGSSIPWHKKFLNVPLIPKAKDSFQNRWRKKIRGTASWGSAGKTSIKVEVVVVVVISDCIMSHYCKAGGVLCVRCVTISSRWILTLWYTPLSTQDRSIAVMSIGWIAVWLTKVMLYRHQQNAAADDDSSLQKTSIHQHPCYLTSEINV